MWASGCSIALVAVTWGLWSRVKNQHVANRAPLYSGLCPTCGYVIDNLPQADDGHVECPECHGAWKLPDLGCACQSCFLELDKAPWANSDVTCPRCSDRHRLVLIDEGVSLTVG